MEKIQHPQHTTTTPIEGLPPWNGIRSPPSRTSLPLPTEIQEEILSYLSLDARVVASLVCRKWGAIVAETPHFKKRRYTYTTPLSESDVTVHRLVATSTGHMQCTLQDGKVTAYTFFYWSPERGVPLKVDITSSPLLDDPVFLYQPADEATGSVMRGQLRFRIGGIICDPIVRGFFWHGDDEVFSVANGVSALTVRRIAERIAERLVFEIEASPLLTGRGLTGEGAALKFRPTARWALAENAGRGMDAIRDNMSVLETSVRFGEKIPYQGYVKQNPYQQEQQQRSDKFE